MDNVGREGWSWQDRDRMWALFQARRGVSLSKIHLSRRKRIHKAGETQGCIKKKEKRRQQKRVGKRKRQVLNNSCLIWDFVIGEYFPPKLQQQFSLLLFHGYQVTVYKICIIWKAWNWKLKLVHMLSSKCKKKKKERKKNINTSIKEFTILNSWT